MLFMMRGTLWLYTLLEDLYGISALRCSVLLQTPGSCSCGSVTQ